MEEAGRKDKLTPSIGLFCPLIEQLGMPNSDVTESTFIELANMLTKHGNGNLQMRETSSRH
ncbi:hypothetical protein SAMD00019534_094250 [Acytostelium subglobosum LB1]|uniref:hypothetical protein n=1 Tax=Acytostelium subglobosum LB1 TaxID=1410327 RepID=UPI0006447E42|nr:hypothetical protein SAMD00019534_094250 [Acytostelium subglobosum LB1]GAM26250.1 hypothetical protein SAMD00019534_094250 [Acytostelium subglobosum LB1]|eukprot:XP_012750804.1 hypothetical protein SAMD00019534_094250 [Acytostelium subglobosum LB1]